MEVAVAGVALKVALGELIKVVVELTKRTSRFKNVLTRLEDTLKRCDLVVKDFAELSKRLNCPDDETKFTRLLEDGKALVEKCSKIKSWDVKKKYTYSYKLTSLDNQLLQFFQIESQANLIRAATMILDGTNELNNKFDQLFSTATSRGGGFSGSCSVPGLPQFVIGLDQHLAELKDMLLKDTTWMLLLSAPGGFGKTTLAKMLCHDADIKGIFGDNILYVTVSTETSLISIAQKLFKHYDKNNFHFKSEEDAKNQIENLVKEKVSGKMLLLVLDDVWPKSESVIQDLKFKIPEFKILVTSRSSFGFFKSTTYELSVLNDEDAKTLFYHSAFPSDGIPVDSLPVDLVNKVD